MGRVFIVELCIWWAVLFDLEFALFAGRVVLGFCWGDTLAFCEMSVISNLSIVDVFLASGGSS